MSYRPDSQSLNIPLEVLLEALSRENINALADAIDERDDSNEWKKDHIDDMNSLLLDVRQLRNRLKRAANDHW